MPWNISPDVESALWSATRQVLPPALCAGATLRQAVIERSRRYTSGRTWNDDADTMDARSAKDMPSPISVPLVGREHSADLAAHALFFAPADAAKIMIPLSELHGRGLLPRGPMRILDVGAGPGAMTLGALDFLHRSGYGNQGRISVHAVDRDRDALRIYHSAVTELGQQLGLDVEVTTEHIDLARPRVRTPAAGLDLILIGSVLNELDAAQSRALVAEHLGLLAEHGSLIIIEPALRETTRALHELRDFVVSQAGAHVFAPCVRQSAPCPALADERDWCHEDRPVRLPERTAKLAANTGLRSHGLKFAYLVLRRDGERLVAEADRAGRVVSQPRKSKGKRECYVCSDEGRSLVRVLKRNRSAVNRDFERVRRGDVLITGSAGTSLAGNLAPEQEIAVRRPAELTGAGPDELDDRAGDGDEPDDREDA